MISKKHKFIFLHVPKTGGNSIQNILFKHSEDYPFIANANRHDGYEDFEVRREGTLLRKHSSLQEYFNFLGMEDFCDFYKFTCIRNPWDRVISHYSYNQEIVRKKKGLNTVISESLIDEDHFYRFIDKIIPLETYLQLDTGQPHEDPFANIDRYLRFDRLDEDFSILLKKLKLPLEPLLHLNKSNHRHYRTYYSDRTREKVRMRFKLEIDYFHFEF